MTKMTKMTKKQFDEWSTAYFKSQFKEEEDFDPYEIIKKIYLEASREFLKLQKDKK